MVGVVVVVGGDLDEEDQQRPIPTNNIKSQTLFFLLNYIDKVSLFIHFLFSGFYTSQTERPKRRCESRNRECFTRKDTVERMDRDRTTGTV